MTGKTSKRSRAVASDNGPVKKTFPEDPTAPASNQDKRKWKGFCEIESEPVRQPSTHYSTAETDQLVQAFFNTMLRKFGIEGVKVQEVVSLDAEMLAFLPYLAID